MQYSPWGRKQSDTTERLSKGGLVGRMMGADYVGRGPGDTAREGGEEEKTPIEEPGTASSLDAKPTLAGISDVPLVQPQGINVFRF